MNNILQKSYTDLELKTLNKEIEECRRNKVGKINTLECYFYINLNQSKTQILGTKKPLLMRFNVHLAMLSWCAQRDSNSRPLSS